MNEQQLFQALGQVDEGFVAEAASAAKQKHPVRRWWVAVACVAIVCAVSISAAALTDVEDRIREYFVRLFVTNSGYGTDVQLDKIPQADILGDVVPDGLAAIRQQIADYQPYMSWYPFDYQRHFETAAEAVEYVGYPQLKLPDFGWEAQWNTVNAMGDGADCLTQISVEAAYTHNGLRMQAFAYLYTEHYTGEMGFDHVGEKDTSYTEGAYTTQSGISCVLMYSSANEKGYYCVDGYLVKDHVFYWLHVIYRDGEQVTAEELLHQWLDEF